MSLCPERMRTLYWMTALMATGLLAGGPVFEVALAGEIGQAAADGVDPLIWRDVLDNWLYTRSGHDRGAGLQHNLARDNIALLMQARGLTTSVETFTHLGNTCYNVVGCQTGVTYPERVYVLGAHYDSANNPGADDNASGVAVLLEVARVLAAWPSACTIRYVAFDRGATDRAGSAAYCAAHAGEDIRGMLNPDMLAYDTGNNYVRIYGLASSADFRNALIAAVRSYDDVLAPLAQGPAESGDQAAFEAAGWPAALLTEGEWAANPRRGTPTDSVDTPGYINYDFAVRATRVAAGFMADQAGVSVSIADADGDSDGDVDLVDLAGFQRCFHGSGWPVPPGEDCAHFDFDADTDVDLADWAALPDHLDGPLVFDCNSNGVDDALELAGGDCNGNGLLDDCERIFFDDFRTDQGWTVSNTGVSGGAWGRAAPELTLTTSEAVAQPGRDAPGDRGEECYVTDGRAGPTAGTYDLDGGPTRLLSPLMAAPAGEVVLGYTYWLFSSLDDDSLTLEVSNDGGETWVTAAVHASSASQWHTHTLRLDQLLPLTAQMRLRFSVADTPNNGVTEAALDDVFLTPVTCAGP